MKIIYFLLFISIAFSSCRKNKASWDADYVIPLINDSLSLGNYVNDSTLGIDNANHYQMNLKRELFRFDLNSELNIPDTTVVSNFSSPLSINVPPGVAIINDAQEKDFAIDNVELSEVYLQNGQIKVVVYNPYSTKIFCDVVLPTTKKNGMVVTDQLIVEAGSIANPTVGTKTIDISYCTMDLKGVLGNSFNKMAYQISIKSDPTGVAVTTTPSHITQVETKIQNLKIMYAKGYFGNVVQSDTVVVDVEALRKWVGGSIDIDEVDLELSLTNSIKAMGRINIKEISTSKDNGLTTVLSSGQINVPQNINSATGAWSTLTASSHHFLFNSNNSNIEEFLENAGPTITVIYDFELNPLGNITSSTNEIFPQSEVKLDLNLDMPLNIGLSDFNLRDTLLVNLSSYQSQLDRAIRAKITANVENGFPIVASVDLVVLDAFNVPVLTISNGNEVMSASNGIPNAQGVPTTKSELFWDLSKEDLMKLKTGKKIVINGLFNTTDPVGNQGTPVQIMENSFFGAKILLNLTYQNQL